jgi:hypothetical protein
MAYRNGTYVAFHTDGTILPGKSDFMYYQLMRAWSAHPDDEFAMVNSHEKTYAVRDSSSRETLRRSLKERLCNSKNMVLIIGPTTRLDDDWVPFEIEQAVDSYEIPIIAAYTPKINSGPIRNPSALAGYWPYALSSRIASGKAHVIHIPFKKEPVTDAISQFSHNQFPNGGGLGCYDDRSYAGWGILG